MKSIAITIALAAFASSLGVGCTVREEPARRPVVRERVVEPVVKEKVVVDPVVRERVIVP